MNFTKICPCFGFADVTKNLSLQQIIEAVVRDPTATPPRPTLGSRPTGWEPLFYLNERKDD